MSRSACVVGIDFGTDSVRSIVADTANGEVLGASVKYYPRWARGQYCDPVANRFRQHPRDYLESMEASIIEALREAGPDAPGRVRGIGVDTTGSTPALADKSVGSPEWLVGEVVSYRGEAIVLEPPELRAQVALRARELAAELRPSKAKA